MSSELKPCPFCGGEAVPLKEGWGDRADELTGEVRCVNDCYGYESVNVETWNRRVLPADVRAALEWYAGQDAYRQVPLSEENEWMKTYAEMDGGSRARALLSAYPEAPEREEGGSE